MLHASPWEWEASLSAQAPRRPSLAALLRRRKPPLPGPLHLWARCVGHTLRAYYFPDPLIDGEHAWLPRGSAAISLVNVAALKLSVLEGAAGPPKTTLGAAGERWGQSVRSQGGLLTVRLHRNASAVVLGVPGWLRTLTFDARRYCLPRPERLDARGSERLLFHTYMFDTPVAPALDLLAFNARWHAERYSSVHVVQVHSTQEALLAAHAGVASAVAAGALRVESKPDYLPQLEGWPMYWHAVAENVALLRAWGTRATLLFLDPDEFLLTPPPRDGRGPGQSLQRAVALHGAVVLARAVFSCPRCGAAGTNTIAEFATRLRDARVAEQYGKVVATADAQVPRLVYVHFADPPPVAVNTSDALVAHVRDALGRSLELSAEAAVAPPVALDAAWSAASAWLRPQQIA